MPSTLLNLEDLTQSEEKIRLLGHDVLSLCGTASRCTEISSLTFDLEGSGLYSTQHV